MYISQQYLELRRSMATWHENEPFMITLDELAGILYCSQRNVKIVLKKMLDEGWIEWKPGRGRGNRSMLTFIASREQVLMDTAKRLVEKGELPEALEQIRDYGEGTTTRERFMEWLSGYFGYQAEPTALSHVEILRFPIHRPIHRLDPIATCFDIDVNVIRQVFDTLVRFDPVKREVIRHVAHHWESDEARQNWVFYLRKGVLFHHGRELTADDVVYSFERLLDPSSGSVFWWLYSEIQSVRALNSTTVAFELSSAHYLFPQFLCSHSASIVPRDVCEQKGAHFFRSPIGSGPFHIVANLPALCTLESFPAYFRGKAHLDRVEIMTVPEDSLGLKDIQWDQIIVHNVPAFSAGNPSWSATEELSQGCSLLTFNLRKDSCPQKRLAFRQALHHLTDRNRMIRELGDTRMYSANSFIPGSVLTAEDFAFNEQMGMKLLQEANYIGESFHLNTSPYNQEDAFWLQKQYGAYGIDVKISVLSWEEMLDPLRMEEADGYIFRLITEEEVVTPFENYRSDLSFIRAHMGDDIRHSCDRLLASVLKEPSAEARLGLIKMTERMLSENRSLLFLLHHKQVTTLHPAVRGLRYNPLGGIDFKDIWFQKT